MALNALYSIRAIPEPLALWGSSEPSESSEGLYQDNSSIEGNDHEFSSGSLTSGNNSSESTESSETSDNSYQDNSSIEVDAHEFSSDSSSGSMEVESFHKRHSVTAVDDFGDTSPDYLNKLPERDDLAVVERTLSEADKLFLLMARGSFGANLNVDECILTPCAVMQSGFNAWVIKNSPHLLHPSDLSVDVIISSIWKKSHDFFVALFHRGRNQELINSEKRMQQVVKDKNIEFQKQGVLTIAFTQRQVELLHILAEREAFRQSSQSSLNIDSSSEHRFQDISNFV